ncbi:MAG: alpha/beta fold hydrolase, partial [Myxococcota bacterium]
SPKLAGIAARELFMRPRKLEPRDWERDAAARSRTEVIDGLNVRTWGEAGSAVVFLHGWEGRSTQWAPFAQRVASMNHRAIALDGPAHGFSDGTIAHPFAFADALMRIDRVLGPFEGAAGHSMGAGAISLALLQGFRAKRVALIAGPSRLDWVVEHFANRLGLSEPTQWQFKEAVKRTTGVGVEQADLARRASKLETKALIVHDREDDEVQFAHAEEYAQHWPNVELDVVEGLGHRRIIRDHEVQKRVVEFLLTRP